MLKIKLIHLGLLVSLISCDSDLRVDLRDKEKVATKTETAVDPETAAEPGELAVNLTDGSNPDESSTETTLNWNEYQPNPLAFNLTSNVSYKISYKLGAEAIDCSSDNIIAPEAITRDILYCYRSC